MKMIPKTKIDAENQLFYAYNTASRAAVTVVMSIREAANSEAFDGSDASVAAISETEYGKSDAGKAALAELKTKIQAAIIAGMRMGKADFKSELPNLVKREVVQKKNEEKRKNKEAK